MDEAREVLIQERMDQAATGTLLEGDLRRIHQEVHTAELSAVSLKEGIATVEASVKAVENAGKDPGTLRGRQTTIVGTVGGRSWQGECMRQCVLSGVDVIRVNASHRRDGEFEELFARIASMLGELQAKGLRRKVRRVRY